MDRWSETCNILFELSNENRLNILFLIKDSAISVSKISNLLDISTQETSRHVARLLDEKLVSRNSDGKYVLNGFGNTILSTINYFHFISSNRDYFSTHPIRDLDAKFVSRVHELDHCTFVPDSMTVFHRIQEMCKNAEEFVYRLTDRHLTMNYPFIQSAADRGVAFKLLEPLDYEPSPGAMILPRVVPSETRGLEKIPVFLAVSEKELAAVSFPLVNGGFDYHSFSSKDPHAIEWGLDVFNHYWEAAVRVDIR
jgi:predicted transcriptional regulator